MMQGVAFFNLMRNLTATGFYTSEIGVKMWVISAMFPINGMAYLKMY